LRTDHRGLGYAHWRRGVLKNSCGASKSQDDGERRREVLPREGTGGCYQCNMGKKEMTLTLGSSPTQGREAGPAGRRAV
jgi:hypothetical protein